MALTDYVKEMEDETNKKFFLVTNEIAEIRHIEQLMAENQNKNWKIIEDQFQTIERNFHVLRGGTQILYSNQQLNFNLETVASRLKLVYADVKSYKAALHAFKNNLLGSVPTLLHQRLTISLMPRESLLAVLNSVYKSQINAPDRLNLAIPTNELHSYYDSKLLREVATVPEGLLLTLAIPLASSQTAFQIYKAVTVPMPQPDPKEAIQWSVEGQYLAISEDSMESTVLTKELFDNCLGSSTYRICHQTMETHLSQSSCLATLFFHSAVTALTVCETEKVLLPSPEKARNQGYGIWLLTSASDSFTLREYNLNQKNAPKRREHPGCNICILTLDCGTQLISKHIKIRPDLNTCDKIKATRINVSLQDPLQSMLSELPDLEELPYFESKTDAGIKLLRDVKTKLIDSPQLTKTDQLDAIAKPIAHDMRLLKPTLTSKLETYVPLKLSLMLTVIVFCGNILLHILFTFLYHRFKVIRDLTPKFLKTQHGDLQLKPVFSVSPDKIDIIDKSRNELKDKIEIQPETIIQEWEDDTEEPLKRTDLVRRDSVASLHSHRRTFSGDLELDPTTVGQLGIIKGPMPKIAAHATIYNP